jgi:hypothetical protein
MVVLTALVIFSPPLFFIERYSLTPYNKPIILGLIIALAILTFHQLSVTKAVISLGFVQLAQATALLALPFIHMTYGYGFDSGYFSLSFQILAGLTLFLVLANSGRASMFARFWVNLHLVIGLLGLAAFIAGILFNLQPLDTFLKRPYYDFGLTYTNIYYQIGSVKLIRVAGFYDEPGTFAFYMTFALLLARLYGMARWKEMLLLAFGLTSLSMAFMVVVLLWAAFSLNARYIKYVVLFALAVIIGFGQTEPEVRDFAYKVTIDRFRPATSGKRLIQGDNRTAIMRENYVAFRDSPYIGHGLHYEDYVGNQYRRSFIANPVAPLATHGVFGATIVNLHVIILIFVLMFTGRLTPRDRVYILLTLLVTLAQRPTTINGFGYLLFILMIYQIVESQRPYRAERHP